MNKIDVHLEHCYGIKNLKQEFDFTDSNTWLIYAPNGVMKTSFAKTFKALSTGKESPCDQMDDTKVSTYDILVDDSDVQIDKNMICVIEPYSESVFSSEDKILTLLSDKETRTEYLKIYKDLEAAKKTALTSLKKTTGSSDYENEITLTFRNDNKESIYEVLQRILPEIKSTKDTFDFNYHDIFDKKNNVKKFIDTNYELFSSYMQQYGNLISESNFFSNEPDGVFGTNEASSLSESLSDDAYFHAGHKLSLKTASEVLSGKELQRLIDEEVSAIFNNPDLKKIFNAIDKKLRVNAELKKFKKAIEKDPSILVRLADYEQFRKDVWLSYLRQLEAGTEQLVELFIENKPGLEAIVEKAKSGGKILNDVIAEFKRRFTVPFTVGVENVDEAILNEAVPSVVFSFEGKPVERKFLLDSVLSQGEKRALYLLNVIFDIESRKLNNHETLFVIDDIADSFDYKNKYAIVEYLSDIDSEGIFKSIILTHNFDLFRTIQSRILVTEQWKKSLIAEKDSNGRITLHEAGSKNVTKPFDYLKKNLHSDIRALIPAIPFVRNLIEFKDGQSSGYLLLTHALHYKEANTVTGIQATRDISLRDLEPIMQNVLSTDSFTYADLDAKILDLLYSEAKKVYCENITAINLSDKLILAMAMRIAAEAYIIPKVTSSDPTKEYGKLYQAYKKQLKDNGLVDSNLGLLGEVNIMTPENIHLNSFMYEPILDMGCDDLKRLYVELTVAGVVE